VVALDAPRLASGHRPFEFVCHSTVILEETRAGQQSVNVKGRSSAELKGTRRLSTLGLPPLIGATRVISIFRGIRHG
jgi:hypothetical protein